MGIGIDRRTFLLRSTGIVATDLLLHDGLAKAAVRRPPRPTSPLLGNPVLLINEQSGPTISVLLRRREDMLFLRVDGYNLDRAGQQLVRRHPGQIATLVFTFVPQHLTEQAFFETATDSGPGNETPARPGSTRALLAAPSRLAFTVPASVSAIPYTAAGLLDWSALELALVPAAAYTPRLLTLLALERRTLHPSHGQRSHAGSIRLPKLRAPGPTETSIELPWHLAISPVAGSQFSHPTEPVTANDSTELWHTRLANGSAPTAADGGALRAVWNFDTQTSSFASPGPPTLNSPAPPARVQEPFRTSLTANDRYEIVKLTSDFTVEGRADVQADRLWLSARGGFLDATGIWDAPTLSLVEWRHLATLGRDQYVKVVDKGFLFPFGHRVAQVTITEREFQEQGGEIVATSRQIVYLVVRQPVVSYDPAETFGIADGGRDFPFRSLTLKTLRTPDLDPPTSFVGLVFLPGGQGFVQTPYVPTVSGTPFAWSFVGTDWVGREIPFTAQAVFVLSEDATDALRAGIVRDSYNFRDPGDPVRVAGFGGRTIAFAQSLKTGDTDLQVNAMTFAASPGAGGSTSQFQQSDQAICYPTLSPSIDGQPTGARALVRLAAAEHASGGAPLGPNASPAVAYYPPFVGTGFSTSANPTANAGNVFMQLLYDATSASNLVFAGGSAGGVLTPNLQIQGLSRTLGPVGDLDNVYKGGFNPSSVFAGLAGALEPKILGGVPLSELIAPVTSFLDGFAPENPDPKALRITTTTDGTVITTQVTWTPDIVTSNPIITPRGGGTTTGFTLNATITTDLANPGNSSFQVKGQLQNFVVNLLSSGPGQFIAITFDALTFTSASGQKANVEVDIAGVQFVGPLSFVQQLQEFMSFGGDGGPKIELLPTGVSADLAVALPTIAVGLFSLKNVAFDAGFVLPFDGTPAVFSFGFSTKASPFQLSLGIFGGGGYFEMQIGTDGVHEIDAGFDFGAMCSVDLGVASGSVSLVAGFQYTYALDHSSGQTTCVLTGYVKLNGSLSVLGIVTMSLTFDLSLTYQEPPASVTGTATVTLSISILFVHVSVSATATKTFTNPGGGSSSQFVGSEQQARLGTRTATLASSPPTFTDQMSFPQWQAFCQAFGTY